MKPSIYVSTYAKCNSGNLFGEWVNLTQFSDIDEFYGYCKELHKDEDEPELMFQDYEGFPEGYVSESYLNPAIFDVLEELNPSEYEDFCHFVSHFSSDSTVEDFRDKFIGHYDNEEDFAYELMEQSTDKGVPDFYLQYFDYQAFARDLFLDGYAFISGVVYHEY